ncbi:MAG: hypothetical protein CM1200mP29_02480 [Verrucomicrobiota bacterium]|nr:MAG: hypothetical protein CM1200mP29_02480 [Verrucomicrobiota bacterium]
MFSTVSPSKDVDGFHPVNVGRLMLGESGGLCLHTGRRARVAFRSGTPIDGARWSSSAAATSLEADGGDPLPKVRACQRYRHPLPLSHPQCGGALPPGGHFVAAIGMAEFIKADMVKPGATVIDVG